MPGRIENGNRTRVLHIEKERAGQWEKQEQRARRAQGRGRGEAGVWEGERSVSWGEAAGRTAPLARRAGVLLSADGGAAREPRSGAFSFWS